MVVAILPYPQTPFGPISTGCRRFSPVLFPLIACLLAIGIVSNTVIFLPFEFFIQLFLITYASGSSCFHPPVVSTGPFIV